MTRRILACLLPAGLAAQVKFDDVPRVTGVGVVGGVPKPKNGQCPICSTMAPPYKQTQENATGIRMQSGCRADAKSDTIVCDDPGGDMWHPREVTCSWCRVKFAQDAEPVSGTGTVNGDSLKNLSIPKP